MSDICITIDREAISVVLWAAIEGKDAEKVLIRKDRKQAAITALLDALQRADHDSEVRVGLRPY